MEWAWNAFWAHIGWSLAPVALGLTALIVYALASIPRLMRQSRCQHPRVIETMACDAVCSVCGKNLGFIGTWRDLQNSKQT